MPEKRRKARTPGSFKKDTLLRVFRLFFYPFKFMRSRVLTCVLMASIAVAMAVITLLEARDNTGEVPYRLYLSWWFTGLLYLFGINLFLGFLNRSAWRWRKLPVILPHLGFLMILSGGFITWKLGLKGDLRVEEGESKASFVLSSPVLHLTWRESTVQGENGGNVRTGNRAARESYFQLKEGGSFKPRGAWPVFQLFFSSAEVTLNSGPVVRIADSIASAKKVRTLVSDPEGNGPPGVRLRVGKAAGETVSLQAGESQQLFLNSPEQGFITYLALDPDDTVSRVRRLFFGETVQIVRPGGDSVLFPLETPADVGKKFTKNGYTVEILQYHPDFKVGKKASLEDPPLNPALKLKVSGPEGEKELYAFALYDFHGNRLPDGSKVVYHRPPPGTSLLLLSRQDSQKKGLTLYSGLNGEGERLLPGKPVFSETGKKEFTIEILSLFKSSRRKEEFVPDPEGRAPPAFKIKAGTGGKAVWLGAEAETPKPLGEGIKAHIGYSYPLGFNLLLEDAVAEYWPASSIPKSFYSQVKVTHSGKQESCRIQTNDPLCRNGFRLYQSGMDRESPQTWSVFSVSYDPGLPVVSAGFFVMIGALVALFVTRFVKRGSKR